MFENVDEQLRDFVADPEFPHREAARQAIAFRGAGDVAALLAVYDDPHPCGMTEIIFAMAGTARPWLNWVPMPSEAIVNVANEVGRRRAEGEELTIEGLALSAAEPPSAVAACQRIAGPIDVEIAEFPEPDIRTPLRRGRYAAWRYDGERPLPTVPEPSAAAVTVLREVAGEPWPSPISGYLKAEPLGGFPVAELIGLLTHAPAAPATPRWEYLAKSTPAYWYRLLQPWVCLGILHHAGDEPWATSTRREVLVDLALGAEDWIADAALFALVTAAYREPAQRTEARELVRLRLDAATAAPRVVTIEESLARLMLITPGCTGEDRSRALAALARIERENEPEPEPKKTRKRRFWQRGD
ncbi:hypothetical protein [Actinoplanes sp. NPDC051851]|uniref:hypothetical protein n=1 Tax=Actinoplanes sp. NPDC051851 TaxID=3154753 RepID=UPI0034146CF6